MVGTYTCAVCGEVIPPGRTVCGKKSCYLRYSGMIHRKGVVPKITVVSQKELVRSADGWTRTTEVIDMEITRDKWLEEDGLDS